MALNTTPIPLPELTPPPQQLGTIAQLKADFEALKAEFSGYAAAKEAELGELKQRVETHAEALTNIASVGK